MPAPIVAYGEALPAWITFGLAVLAARADQTPSCLQG
jgi:hypothetical protein